MMGRADAGIGDIAVRLVERHAGPVAADQQQLERIYNDLSNHEDILVAL